MVPAHDLGQVVATVGETSVFAKQVAAKAKATGRHTPQALEEIVDTYLLAELALHRGLAADVSQDSDVRSAMVQRLLEREAEPSLRGETLPEELLRSAYEKAIDYFVHPRIVEIAVLAIQTGAHMQKDAREPRERTARELAALLKKHPPRSLEEFEAVAADAQWKAKHVTLRRLQQTQDRPLSSRVGKEVANLHAPGDITPLVIDQDGCFIARYVAEKPAENVSFAEARPVLVDRLYEKFRQQQFGEFVENLKRMHRIETHFDRLSSNE